MLPTQDFRVSHSLTWWAFERRSFLFGGVSGGRRHSPGRFPWSARRQVTFQPRPFFECRETQSLLIWMSETLNLLFWMSGVLQDQSAYRSAVTLSFLNLRYVVSLPSLFIHMVFISAILNHVVFLIFPCLAVFSPVIYWPNIQTFSPTTTALYDTSHLPTRFQMSIIIKKSDFKFGRRRIRIHDPGYVNFQLKIIKLSFHVLYISFAYC